MFILVIRDNFLKSGGLKASSIKDQLFFQVEVPTTSKFLFWNFYKNFMTILKELNYAYCLGEDAFNSVTLRMLI